MVTPRISVLVCTWNLPDALHRLLRSLSDQILPVSEFEVIVVDNNSTDNTRAVLTTWQQECSYRLIYLFEPKPGKTHALNAGIAACSAPIIACTDHDCVPEPEWLSAILQAFETPGVALLGGPALSVFPDEVRKDSRRLFLGERFLGDFAPYKEMTELKKKNLPLGMNLAFLSEVAEKVGGFDTSLGPRPGAHAGREESDFVRRAAAEGYRVFYSPNPVIRHHIEPRRATMPAVLKQAYESGIGTFMEQYSKKVEGSFLRQTVVGVTFAAQIGYSWLRYVLLLPSYRRRTIARFRASANAGKMAGLQKGKTARADQPCECKRPKDLTSGKKSC